MTSDKNYKGLQQPNLSLPPQLPSVRYSLKKKKLKNKQKRLQNTIKNIRSQINNNFTYSYILSSSF